jgi:hypothetical protein
MNLARGSDLLHERQLQVGRASLRCGLSTERVLEIEVSGGFRYVVISEISMTYQERSTARYHHAHDEGRDCP